MGAKPRKEWDMKLQKTTIETIKTVVIAVLVTLVVAFVCGMKYQAHNQAVIDNAVQHAVSNHSTAKAPLK